MELRVKAEGNVPSPRYPCWLPCAPSYSEIRTTIGCTPLWTPHRHPFRRHYRHRVEEHGLMLRLKTRGVEEGSRKPERSRYLKKCKKLRIKRKVHAWDLPRLRWPSLRAKSNVWLYTFWKYSKSDLSWSRSLVSAVFMACIESALIFRWY